MRDSGSVSRSLARYLYLALGDAWEVRFAIDEGTFKRPFVRVTPSTPVSATAHGPVQVECRRTYNVVAFPEVGGSEEEGALLGEECAMQLFTAFSMGVYAPAFSTHSLRAHPKRVPLWNYDGVSLRESIEDVEAREGAPRRAPSDFMRLVEDPSFNSMPDPNSDYAYVVTADLRVQWFRSIALPLGPLVDGVDGTFDLP